MLTVRRTVQEDLPRVMEIYAYAREQMKLNGNPTQWGDSHPAQSIIESDIENGTGYVCVDEQGEVVGCFTLFFGADPTYAVIDQGEWHSDKPYATIHRIAAGKGSHGVLKTAIAFAESQIDYLRIDTHANNAAMNAAVQKYGFQYCGIIYLANGDPRNAYDKTNFSQTV